MTRTGRRLSRAGLFVVETLGGIAATGAAPGTPRARAERLSWMAENLCAMHGIDVVTHGAPPDEPCVVVANHVTYIDPVAILRDIPACAVAKQEVGDWPVLGEGMRNLGVLMVDRDSAASGARVLRSGLRALREGVPMLAFPEGTTTTGDRVLPFKRGVFGLARIASVPVVPVSLRYDSVELAWVGTEPFLPHYLRTVSRREVRVEVCFHEPIAPSGTPETIAERARSIISAHLSKRPRSIVSGWRPVSLS